MKRNYPPETSAEIVDEHRIIEERLQKLYPTSQLATLKIAYDKRGHYCDTSHHVRLVAETKLHYFAGHVQYSSSLGYHYLEPYQALYHMECRQLMIFFNELPMSLAEAYKLLLQSKFDFQNYLVFSHLNRNGYFCLKPESLVESSHRDDGDGQETSTSNCSITDLNTDIHSETLSDIDKATTPIFNIHTSSGSCTYDEILNKLRHFGPREYHHYSHRKLDNDDCNADIFAVTFDAYKRESFVQNKPRRGKLGCADYHIVISDQQRRVIPSGKLFANFQLKYGHESCKKLLFAIIDSDNTLSFLHFDPMDPTELEFNANQWPEQIRKSELANAIRF